MSVQGLRLLHFNVYGTVPRYGFVKLKNGLRVETGENQT
jgi:hypothetical protein